MMIRCAVVDDEPLARKILVEHIGAIRYLEVQANLSSAIELQDYLVEHSIDVLFLDINMPKLSGLQLVRALKDPPIVIFTTAYAQYAIDAFEVQAFDYLLKPISFERFLQAIDRVRAYFKNPSVYHQTDWITIKEGTRIYKIDTCEISFLQAYGDYVKIHTAAKTYLSKDRLANIKKQLPDHFEQVHRSYIINIDAMQYIEGNFVMIENTQVPISATYKELLMKRL